MLLSAESGRFSCSFSKSSVAGFTLLEVLVAVGLIAAVAVIFVQNQLENLSRRTAESLAQDMLSIANTSLTHFSNNGEWPDQDNDCSGLLTSLINAKAYPPNSSPVMEAKLVFECSIDDDYGRVLQVKAEYPRKSDQDHADVLLSYLPTSVRLDDYEGIPTVVHYVSQPRKASNRFHFHKLVPNSEGKYVVEKPECLNISQARYMLLPQAVCVGPSEDGLGGFYFRAEGTGDSDPNWSFTLMVARGQANDNSSDYSQASSTCGGQTVEVGAITYCD